MKETIEQLEKTETCEKIFDTCFLLYEIEHHHEKNLEGGMTSFTAEELIHVIHKIKPELKIKARHFLKNCKLKVIDVDVSPGDREGERKYVENTDPELLKEVRDPSDAVLIATAIKKNIKEVYTRDKHHLYNTELENYLQKYNITVYNNI